MPNAKPKPSHRPLRLLDWKAGDDGTVGLDLGVATAAIAVARDGSVRLRAASGSTLPPDPGEAIGRKPWRPARADTAAREEGGLELRYESHTGYARVEIDEKPFAVRVIDRTGARVADFRELAFAPDGSARVALTLLPGERCYGLGEKSGGLDKRGRRWVMRNCDANLRQGSDPLYVSIPFLLGLTHAEKGGWARGVLLDAFGASSFDVAAAYPDRVVLETRAGGIDTTVFPGPRPSDVLARFTARVGRTPLPPRWALGHHQSRWSYASEEEVRKVARELRARGIPTDAIHLDIDYMDGYRVFTWHPRRFPNPKELVGELAKLGFRVVAIVDPGVKVDPGYRTYAEGRERGYFCRNDTSVQTVRVWPKDAVLPDFNRAEVRDWWGQQHRALVDAGVAGVWNDMNEPAGWRRDVRLGRAILPYLDQDLSRMVQADPVDESRTVPHEEVRNIYGQQECRATRRFLESAAPDERPFVLSRAGFAGIQRHAAVWTGDNASRWSHLRRSIPMLLNLSVSGVAFCGADIGGFGFSCTPELYARWIQIGALYPFARTHTIWFSRRQEPWSFGKRVEAIARDALRLRMRLLPYLYSLFHESAASGAPLWRPLFFEFPDDPDAAAVEDQVMIGPWLLAAPVLERGSRERVVYLPPGVWISWHDDARYVGPRTVRVAAPLERIPLFARGGAVIPTQSGIEHVGQTPEEPLILEIFPGGDGASELVEDDGESTAYQRGAVARTTLRLRDRAGGRLRLEIGKRKGEFEVPRRVARIVAHACPPPRAVFLDGTRLEPGRDVPGFFREASRVNVRFADEGEARSLEIDPAP